MCVCVCVCVCVCASLSLVFLLANNVEQRPDDKNLPFEGQSSDLSPNILIHFCNFTCTFYLLTSFLHRDVNISFKTQADLANEGQQRTGRLTLLDWRSAFLSSFTDFISKYSGLCPWK